jgi:hypothetical protein
MDIPKEFLRNCENSGSLACAGRTVKEQMRELGEENNQETFLSILY